MIKHFLSIVLLCVASLAVSAAESKGDRLRATADRCLEQKDYIPARYHYLQAFNAYAGENELPKAVDAGVKAAALYHRENYFKEAFELLGKVDAVIDLNSDGKTTKLHYAPARERLEMYLKLKNAARARESLDQMKAAAVGDSAKVPELLLQEADYYYAFGNNAKGDEAVNKLIALYENSQDYDSADNCYRQLIDRATASKNTRLLNRTYARYNHWSDSIKTIRTEANLKAAKNEIVLRDETIAERDHTISVKTGVIITLSIIIAILAAALVVGGVILARFMLLSRKLRRMLDTAIEHNELKTSFIHNISAQMAPTLDTLDPKLPAVGALKNFASDVQELSDLESTINEPYELEDVNIINFCDELVREVTPYLAPDVTLAVNAPKMTGRFNAEATASILSHLLFNAARHTPAGGKITIEYKKRGAKSSQFIITDTGCGIDEDKREKLFRPFTELHDLTKGDALGLPICSLRAQKLNGSLSIDSTYNKGARFILDLHS